ncbi:MAG: enolase C-terminal domain-like protein [Betaproteobacteria bacterium]
MRPARLRVVAVELFERPVRLRLPFRFGAVTVTACPQAFVRAAIEFEDGRRAHGSAAEMMVPKWFDKSAHRSDADNIDDLRDALRRAAHAYTSATELHTAFGHFANHYRPLMREGSRCGVNDLTTNFGAAVLDRAVLDALCRALGTSFADVVRVNAAGIDASLTDDLRGFDLDGFLRTLRARSHIAARHTVGMLDPLEGNAPGEDALPRTLRQVIAAYGNTHFKLKLGGDPEADIGRLTDIAAVLDHLPSYAVTLDGNEQYPDLDTLARFCERLDAAPQLACLAGRTLYLEQPLPRSLALDVAAQAVPRRWPLLIDESDATLDAFPRAKVAGYHGVSSKSCKGVYKSLLNAARCAQWNAAECSSRFFISGEDLTMQPGLGVQQDLALAALLGLRHVERNGHHYVDGFAGGGASTPEQERFLVACPGLYERSHGSVRLSIRAGVIDLAGCATPGFASPAEPDWTGLSPLAPRAPRNDTATPRIPAPC